MYCLRSDISIIFQKNYALIKMIFFKGIEFYFFYFYLKYNTVSTVQDSKYNHLHEAEKHVHNSTQRKQIHYYA